jgi:sphingosine kinase
MMAVCRGSSFPFSSANHTVSSELTVPHHYVLAGRFDDEDHLIHVSYLINKLDKRKGISLQLVKVTGTVQDEVQAFEWTEKLMNTIYEGKLVFFISREPCLMTSPLSGYGIQRSRRLRVLVNPNGGVVRRLGSLSPQPSLISRLLEKGCLCFLEDSRAHIPCC